MFAICWYCVGNFGRFSGMIVCCLQNSLLVLFCFCSGRRCCFWQNCREIFVFFGLLYLFCLGSPPSPLPLNVIASDSMRKSRKVVAALMGFAHDCFSSSRERYVEIECDIFEDWFELSWI